jgi:hypothetical protein
MRLLFSTIIIFLIGSLYSCQSENRDNSRAYVEGRITGNQLDYNKISILLKSGDRNIAEAIPNGSGQFVLSGPMLTDSFSLVLNKKIRSFSSSKTGCSISADSLEILIPAGNPYIVFNEITLK